LFIQFGVMTMAINRPIIKKRRDRRFWQQQVAAWQQSGLRPGLYVEQQQLCPDQFKRWRYRFTRESKVASAAAFISIQVDSVASNAPQPIVLSSQNGLQLHLDIASLQQPALIAFVKELLCGR
jgi:hypothetical protein